VPTGASYKLFYATNGGLSATPDAATGLAGADGSFDLTLAPLNDAIRQKYPHLAGATGLQLAALDAAKIAQLASSQFAIAQYDGAGNLVQVTSLQAAGMLDDVFATKAAKAELGLSFNLLGMPTFRVWAPTAKSVALNLYASANDAGRRPRSR
jgi:pullulanase